MSFDWGNAVIAAVPPTIAALVGPKGLIAVIKDQLKPPEQPRPVGDGGIWLAVVGGVLCFVLATVLVVVGLFFAPGELVAGTATYSRISIGALAVVIVLRGSRDVLGSGRPTNQRMLGGAGLLAAVGAGLAVMVVLTVAVPRLLATWSGPDHRRMP